MTNWQKISKQKIEVVKEKNQEVDWPLISLIGLNTVAITQRLSSVVFAFVISSDISKQLACNQRRVRKYISFNDIDKRIEVNVVV